MKTRKWYSTKVKPDRKFRLIIMTDMGAIFEASYTGEKFLVSVVKNGKVYFEGHINQSSIVKWMKV